MIINEGKIVMTKLFERIGDSPNGAIGLRLGTVPNLKRRPSKEEKAEHG
jgi:hypothetical protein